MQISRRVTNGLAWAGVALVVGIPAIDAVTGRFAEPQAEQVSLVTGPSETAAPTPASRPAPAPESAAATPAKPAAVETASAGDAVDSFIQSGRPLPSYISDAPAQTASTPEPQRPAAPAAPAPSQTAATPPASQPATPPRTEQTASTTTTTTQPPIETAALSPQITPPTVEPARVAPTPMPLSMRPAARPAQATASTPPAQAPGLVSTPGFNPQIVIPDTVVTGTVAPPSGVVMPPAPVPGGDVLIGPADLQDWETGPLSDFIARRQSQNEGYVSGDEWWAGAGNGGSSATYQTWPPREAPRYRVYPLY